MMRFEYKDCIKKGLLKKIPASKEKAKRSIKKAVQWLTEAENTCQSKAYDSSVLTAYLCMFHSERSVLFFDGYREKIHACVARYLEEKYVKQGKLEKRWVELLDHQREIRHNDQYDLSFFSTKEEAREATISASKFLKRMKELLKLLEGIK